MTFPRALTVVALSLLAASEACATELKQGDAITVDGKKGVIQTVDALPFVDNTYTQRMIWQKPEPRLQQLRDELRLDDKIAPGKSEFERQLRLLEFVHRLWEYEDPADLKGEYNPLEIITLQKKEKRFYCEMYACVLAGTAASEGWVCRLLSIWHHTFCEMWSNQYKKWMLFDPNNNLWAEKNGVPQSMAEFIDDYFQTELKNVSACFGVKGVKRGYKDLAGKRYKDYGVIGIHQNTDLLERRFNTARMFCFQTPNAEKSPWEKGKEIVANRFVDPYFPINQAALTLEQAAGGIAVAVKTLTPNFKTFRCRVDEGKWLNCGPNFTWPLHGGKNLLEVKSVNAFEVDGPGSKVAAQLEGDSKPVPLDAIGNPAPEEENKALGMPALNTAKPQGVELVPVDLDSNFTMKKEWVSMWYTQGQWIEWTANVPAPGEYTASLVYSESYYPKRELEVNGKVVPGLESFTLPYTGGWRIWKKAELPVKLPLHAGKNTLRFTCLDETSLWLNEIRLSKPDLKDVVLSGGGYTAEGGGKSQKTFVPNNGFFIGWDGKGHWLEWNVDAAAGEYDVFLRVGALVPATRELKVNGVSTGEHPKINPTGGWRSWAEVPFGKAKLQAGKNVIRMEAVNGESMNLNAIRFIDESGREIFVNAVDFTAEGGGNVQKMK